MNNFFRSQVIYSLQIVSWGEPQSSGDVRLLTNDRVNMEKVVSAASPELSLSWCFEGVKSWHVGKKYQFLGGGWVLRDEASWECRNVLLHTVCISLSLDWKVAPCPGFSSSLNMWILWSCNPKCGYSGLFHACSPGCWRICGGGATLFWNRWCTPRTSPPPPARPPWSRPPHIYIYMDSKRMYGRHVWTAPNKQKFSNWKGKSTGEK